MKPRGVKRKRAREREGERRSVSFPSREKGNKKNENILCLYTLFSHLLFDLAVAFLFVFCLVATVAPLDFRFVSFFAWASLSALLFSLHTLGTSNSPPQIPLRFVFASSSASR